MYVCVYVFVSTPEIHNGVMWTMCSQISSAAFQLQFMALTVDNILMGSSKIQQQRWFVGRSEVVINKSICMLFKMLKTIDDPF